MNKITYRPYVPQDFKALSDIINITWGHEKSYSPTTAVRLSNAYLRLCMTEQTFTQVALNNGKPIGIIMGKKHHAAQCIGRFKVNAGIGGGIGIIWGPGRGQVHIRKVASIGAG